MGKGIKIRGERQGGDVLQDQRQVCPPKKNNNFANSVLQILALKPDHSIVILLTILKVLNLIKHKNTHYFSAVNANTWKQSYINLKINLQCCGLSFHKLYNFSSWYQRKIPPPGFKIAHLRQKGTYGDFSVNFSKFFKTCCFLCLLLA